MALTVVLLVVGYLLGCFNTGYYLVRWWTGSDIRTVFSGNTGSRNVGRLLGTPGFVLTFVGDAGKGLVAVWLARHWLDHPLTEVAVLLAVIAGHIWPIQLAGRGGKGFATFAGGMVIWEPWVLVAGLALCVLLFPVMKRTTKTGLVVLALSPLLVLGVQRLQEPPLMPWAFGVYCLVVVLVLYAHRSNIRKEFLSSSVTD